MRGWGWPDVSESFALGPDNPRIVADGCCALTTQHLPLNKFTRISFTTRWEDPHKEAPSYFLCISHSPGHRVGFINLTKWKFCPCSEKRCRWRVLGSGLCCSLSLSFCSKGWPPGTCPKRSDSAPIPFSGAGEGNMFLGERAERERESQVTQLVWEKTWGVLSRAPHTYNGG